MDKLDKAGLDSTTDYIVFNGLPSFPLDVVNLDFDGVLTHQSC